MFIHVLIITVTVSDWSRFPDELKIKEKKKRQAKPAVKPNLHAKKARATNVTDTDVTKTLEVCITLL